MPVERVVEVPVEPVHRLHDDELASPVGGLPVGLVLRLTLTSVLSGTLVPLSAHRQHVPRFLARETGPAVVELVDGVVPKVHLVHVRVLAGAAVVVPVDVRVVGVRHDR